MLYSEQRLNKYNKTVNILNADWLIYQKILFALPVFLVNKRHTQFPENYQNLFYSDFNFTT